jgi:hypothetical protein
MLQTRGFLHVSNWSADGDRKSGIHRFPVAGSIKRFL